MEVGYSAGRSGVGRRFWRAAKGCFRDETTLGSSLARGFAVGGWVDVGLRGDGGGAGKFGGRE